MNGRTVLCLLVACLPGVAAPTPAPLANKETAAGATLLAPFKRDLQAALMDGMAAGPDEAVAACRLRAPKIADALSTAEVKMGRTSHRLRNPANSAPDWVSPVLAGYLAVDADPAPVTVKLDDDRAGYVEPILMQPLCLTCHGAEIAAEVSEKIEALYPDDRATGFSAGELRGVFWVEYKAEP